MQFEEKPDYELLRNIFKGLFYRSRLEFDYNFDWLKKQRRDRMHSRSIDAA
jgi:hypothetical protein